MHELSLILLSAVVAASTAHAEVPMDRHVEILFENAEYNDTGTRIHMRIGGEYIPPIVGQRCLDPAPFGKLVVTDVQVESQRNPAGGGGPIAGSIGVGAVYPYGVQATLFATVPGMDSMQTHSMRFDSGVVLPTGSQLCFRGYNGEFGVAVLPRLQRRIRRALAVSLRDPQRPRHGLHRGRDARGNARALTQ